MVQCATEFLVSVLPVAGLKSVSRTRVRRLASPRNPQHTKEHKPMNPEPVRIDPYQLVTDTILAHLERGVVPWRCPWNRSTGRPRNFHSGREYQGINTL